MVLYLIVKTPNYKIPDQTVECDFLWTVGELKKHLYERLPSKPLKKCSIDLFR